MGKMAAQVACYKMSDSPLFEPTRFGSIELPNRVVMAPLTRCRASEGRTPNEMMAEYYRQRASAGLIISEATSVTPMGVGYPDTPGIWSNEQIRGWKRVTELVHQEGGRILLQLWHVGRVSDPIYLNGELPVAPSAIAPSGHVRQVRPIKPYVTPRPLETDEIPEIVEAYRQAAQNALEAGFDGVEIHGANGYLLDQFLQDGTNKRTDAYGGPIENRARLMLEVVDAASSVWGPDRVGLHLSPRGDSHDMSDSSPAETFGYVAREAGKRRIAFLFVRESLEDPRVAPVIKSAFGGPVILNQQLSREDGERLIREGEADAIAWGQLFISNPDLVERFRQNAPLNAPKSELFYSSGAQGYIDYPTLD